MTPTAKPSVFIILQIEISSGLISKKVMQCNKQLLAPALFVNAKTSSQIKCLACKTKQGDALHSCRLGKHCCFLNCSMCVCEAREAQ